MKQWLQSHQSHYQLDLSSLAPASNDASFRRYFRLGGRAGSSISQHNLIVMDAPPPMEDIRPFVQVTQWLGASGASLPKVFESDVGQGFLLLEDFGNTTYLQVLTPETQKALYSDAFDALIKMQLVSADLSRTSSLAPYDEALLRRELELYPEWYLSKHKGLLLSDTQRKLLDDCFDKLIGHCLAQAKVFVHRDFHSRNLMLLAGSANPGILDFQDAVMGPITYDLVSLLRDAYIRWDEEVVIDGCARYWEKARKAGLPVPSDFSEFYRDFEWMGLQRHLKVLGIFARLYYRDGKDRYLDDLPLVLDYVVKVARRYQAFAPLVGLIEQVEALVAPGVSKVGYTF